MRIALHDGWTVQAVGGDVPESVAGVRIPATIPGSIHTDLLAAGLIPDPYLDLNEALVQWVGHADWRYECTFDWRRSMSDDTPERVDLVFEGLDTVATVELNAAVLARTENMHRSYRMDAREALHEGTNTLAVTLASPVKETDRRSEALGRRPHVNQHPFNALRKMACNYGWDWGPDLVTSGIWRPACVEAWRTARLASVRPLVTVARGQGRVSVHVDTERTSDEDLRVRARVGDQDASVILAAGATSTVVELVIADPELWWPHGYGAQPLYEVTVELTTLRGAPLDDWNRRTGFRTVELRREADEHGTSFVIVVNGREVFVKGANWIPDDVFPHRVTRERYAQRIAQSCEAGINLLRVWAGGIYETRDFYDICDERGVLVWQDFLFACAAYSEEEPLRSEVVAEARENVARLVPHPSLSLWNGNNENLWGHVDWGWQPRLDGRTWGEAYYFDLLPSLVAELDPTRPYNPGSPWSLTQDRHPNDPDHGCVHIWDVWNNVDYTAYRGRVPRFVSEFGWQGPPTWATLSRVISDDPLTPESPGVLLHQKAAEGNRKLEAGLVPHLPQPKGMDDFHWAMQLNQARAVAFGIAHFRSHAPRCAGAVVWQLNDCWPVTSWAAVDGDGRLKPLWYALRRAFSNRLLTIQPRQAGLAVVACNDTDRSWTGMLVVARRSFTGQILDHLKQPFEVGPRAVMEAPLPEHVATPDTASAELITAETASAERAFWFFMEDRDGDLPAPLVHAKVESIDDGYQVVVSAASLVKDLALLADKVATDAVVDNMLVTLLPGETVVFHVRTSTNVPPSAFTNPSVLRSANQLLHP
jgi:beta-mannosidase